MTPGEISTLLVFRIVLRLYILFTIPHKIKPPRNLMIQQCVGGNVVSLDETNHNVLYHMKSTMVFYSFIFTYTEYFYSVS